VIDRPYKNIYQTTEGPLYLYQLLPDIDFPNIPFHEKLKHPRELAKLEKLLLVIVALRFHNHSKETTNR
jgi:hypothetical protein